MRWVLANRVLDRVGGTEVHLLTLGSQLRRLGHEVWVYSPRLGAFAARVRDSDLPVTDRLGDLPDECEVVFAQDTIVSYELAERYPRALAVYRVCGDVVDFQLPPQVPDVADAIVVLSDRYARLVRGCATKASILRLRVPVDLDRLVPLSRPRRRPRRAVILGSYPQRAEAVREAWEPHGIEVVQVGGVRETHDVAVALAEADIVVGKSRAALDAMACGRAVYVYDLFGGDGWVTPATYPALERDNFAGLATDRTIRVADLERDLADYDPEMGVANRDLVVQHHSPRDHVLALLDEIADRRPAARPVAPLAELARLSALAYSWEQLADERREAQAELHHRLLSAEARATDAVEAATAAGRASAEAQARARQLGRELETARRDGDARALRAELDAIQSTRAWRLTNTYWRLKRRVRGPRT